MYRAIDVMGFAGGFTLGMVQAGFKLVRKCEMAGGFGVANCDRNRHLLGHDWDVQVGVENWTIPEGGADVVFGNPPCSGFSVMSMKDFRGADSKINHCMWSFADYVARVRPQIAVFESVQQAFTNKGGIKLMRQLREYVEDKTSERYTLYHVRHNAYSVGGPAQRRRYFWLISRMPFGVEVPRPTHLPLLNDVIGDLVPLEHKWGPQPYRAEASEYAKSFLSDTGMVDGHVFIDNPLTRRIRDLLAEVEWGPRESIATVTRRYYQRFGRLPQSFAASEEKLVGRDFMMGFTTPVRWAGDAPARVITGGAMVMVVHPVLNRTVTHRECARILGFPDDWRIEPLKDIPGLHMTWGKGITVQCGRWIGKWIKRALRGEPGSVTGEPLGEREYDIDVTHAWKSATDTLHSSPDMIQSSGHDHARMRAETPPIERSHIVTEPVEATEVRSRRGRPRPTETIERDEQVYAVLDTPKTKAQIAEATGLSVNQVYLSLFRLRNAGRVIKHGRNLWARADVQAAA